MESLKNPWKIRWSFCFAELVRFAGWKRISDLLSDSLVEGCFLNVVGLGYHDVTLRSGGRSCPEMTKVYSRVDEGTDKTLPRQRSRIKLGTLFVCVFHTKYRIQLGGRGSSR